MCVQIIPSATCSIILKITFRKITKLIINKIGQINKYFKVFLLNQRYIPPFFSEFLVNREKLKEKKIINKTNSNSFLQLDVFSNFALLSLFFLFL